MAKVQTRRTVTLSETDYQRLQTLSKGKVPLSQLLTTAIEQWAKIGVNSRAILESDLAPTPKQEPGFVVNVDFVLTASSEDEAKQKVAALTKKHRIRALIIGADLG